MDSKIPKKGTLMRFRILVFLSVLLLLSQIEWAMAGEFIVVENEFHWYSPNLTRVPTDQVQSIPLKKSYLRKNRTPLGDMAYNRHFDSYGVPPPLNFLRPLKKGASPLAQIEGRYVLFMKTGNRIPLNRSVVPSRADPADPYLLSIPDFDRVFIAYPYYLFRCKENKYITEVYSDRGALLATFDTLPSHFCLSNPHLLISPEKSGCCDSLQWSIRFYNLDQYSVSEYNCPEGFCGDVLFTRLGENGPFVIVQEIVGNAGEVGSSLQTNVYIIENDGTLSASGKIIHAVHDPNINKHMMQALSPYAVSNLVAVDPLAERNSWLIRFGVDTEKKILRLVSTYRGPAPSVVFLLSKDPSAPGNKRLVKTAEKTLGNLPLLGILEPGQHTFSVCFDDGNTDSVVATIRSDRVNFVMF